MCAAFLMRFSSARCRVGSALITYALDEQSRHVAYIVAALKQRGKKRSEAAAEAEANWVAEIVEKARDAESFQEACTPLL